jgi:Hint module
MSTNSNHNENDDTPLLSFMNQATMTHVIELSAEHLIFVGSSKHPIRAADIRVGDELSGGNIVATIEYVKRRGVYAPLTQSGDMMISGIYASNYVQVFNGFSSKILFWNQHDWGHIIFAPQRWFCTCFLESCKKEMYFNGYGLVAYLVVGTSDMVKLLGDMLDVVFNEELKPYSSFTMYCLFLISMTILFFAIKETSSSNIKKYGSNI